MTPSHSRAKELFLAALSLPPEARPAFLAKECGSDEELRQEVVSLLAFHSESPNGGNDREEPVPERFTPGDVFAGRYRMITRIGRGGMGEVWHADDLVLRTPVALKFIRTPEPEGRDRILHEARLARQITHPAVCRVFDVGDAEGEIFLSMELVRGENLAVLLRRMGRLPSEKVVDIARQLCAGLDAAHEQGVLHRDLKPANILVDENGRVRITDFGIAVQRTAATFLTPMGTPGYMAPEQLRPGAALSERTDVYLLGLVLYEMLTGRHAFPRSEPEARADDSRRAPLRPSLLVPGVPPDLERSILDALSPDPDQRPASAAVFAASLPALEPLRDVGSRSRRRIVLAVGAAASVLLLSALGFLTAVRRSEEPRPRAGAERPTARARSLAVLPFVNLSRDPAQEYFADGLTDELTTELAKLPGVQVASRGSAFTFKGSSDVDIREKGRRLGVSAILEGTVRRDGDRMRLTAQLANVTDGLVLWSDAFDRKVRDTLAAQQEIAAAVAAALRVRLGSAAAPSPRGTSVEAHDLYLRGRYFANQGTREGLERSLDYYRRALEQDPSYAPAHAGIAFAYLFLSDAYLLPTDAYPKGTMAAERAIALDDGLAEAHGLLSQFKALYAWDWDGARREAERALALNPSESFAHITLYIVRITHGDHDGAISALHEWLRLDPLSPLTNHLVVLCLLVAGEPEAALAQANRAEEVAPGFLYTDSWTAQALVANGRCTEALPLFERAERALGRPVPGLALAYARMGRRAEAEAALRRLETEAARAFVVPEQMAQVLVVLGDHDGAFSWLERGVEGRSGIAPFYPQHPDFDPLRKDPRWGRLQHRLHLD